MPARAASLFDRHLGARPVARGIRHHQDRISHRQNGGALQVTAFTPFGKLKGEVMVVPFLDEKKAAPSLARVTAGRNPDHVYGRTPV